MAAIEKEIQYWLFQCKPEVINLKGVLKDEVLDFFPIKAHLSKIKTGDMVVLWLSGTKAGCYALAKVISPVEDLNISKKLEPYFLKTPETKKMVGLQIQYNLWNKPITKDILARYPYFDQFPAGIPGSTFRIEAKQFKSLINFIHQLDLLEEPIPDYEIPLLAKQPTNLILYGPPGTGKTYQTLNYALSIIEDKNLEELSFENRAALQKRYQEYLEKGQISMVTFHASFAYEDFVEGIKPVIVDQILSYELQEGIFKIICQKAQSEWENCFIDKPQSPDAGLATQVPKYVLIIDEINRGNIPNIFGELITLLDDDKRKGRPEEKELLLPYSKKAFSVPANLYILGTMNTADRSTTHLDAALRRRFAFQKIPPNPSLLKFGNSKDMVRGIQLDQVLKTMNNRIRVLLDEHHMLGHALFMKIHNLEDLKEVFYHSVIPQLQEYFFNDLGKIGLILGNDFIEKATLPTGKKVFADFNYPFVDELLDHSFYRIKSKEEIDETAFINIYKS